MMKTGTQLRRLLLAAFVLLGVCSIHAYDFVVDGIYYEKNYDGFNTVSVTFGQNMSGTYSGSVTIPSIVSYNGTMYAVTSIGYAAFSDCTSLTDVTIPNSVINIFYSAFVNCTSLKSITIPNSVSLIGDGVFINCTGLTSITIGKNVTSIGNFAFMDCNALERVNISNLSAWCRIKFQIRNISNPLYYAHHLFLNGEEIKDLVIPDDVSTINDFAFTGCSGLTSVTFPSSVTSIGAEAFMYCHGLLNVSIPESVTTIGNMAFMDCNNLTSVTCLAKNPPTMASASCFTCYNRARLLVPPDAVNTYAATNYWNRFYRIVGIGANLGDVNGDEEVSIADVNALIDLILSDKYTDAADINSDGEVSIADINALIDILLDEA